MLEDDDDATGSDHEIIEWMVDLGGATVERVAKVKRWGITELFAGEYKQTKPRKSGKVR